jgi:hypothetical protein
MKKNRELLTAKNAKKSRRVREEDPVSLGVLCGLSQRPLRLKAD